MASPTSRHVAGAAWAGALCALAALAWPARAPAQDAPPSPAALVDEVEVIGRLPGPALWRVSTPTAQLWILGLTGPMPKGFQWDNRRVAAALDGSRELLLPPSVTGGLGDIFAILVDPGHVLHLPPGHTLRGDLPAALNERLESAAHAIGQNPARYDHWRPVLAAMILMSDGVGHYHLGPGGAQGAVMALAKTKRVKLRPMAGYKVGELLHGLAATPSESAEACITLAAGTVERLPVDAPRRAAAWASGDLKTLKAIGDASDGGACLDAAPAVAALRDRVAADWAKALGQALATPGKTVVAIDMDTLTRPGGLLQQLKAQGLDVIGPAY